jgi:regulatory subunit for Cdc7p protein kinase
LTKTDSLHTLLEDEKVHGTRERDVTAPRPDYYYFKPGSKYVLIEDAIAKHRPVLVKEYNQGKDGPEYPVLYEAFLRPSSANQHNLPADKVRERAWALYVDRDSYDGEHPPAELRRSNSLRSFPDTPQLPDASGFQAASGNSQIITSNIASTSTANYSPIFPDGFQALGRNRGIAQLSRVQVLKSNATKRNLGDFNLNHRRATTGSSSSSSSSSSSYPTKTFMTQDQLVRMLRQARAPVVDNGRITYEMRVENRRKVDAGIRSKNDNQSAGYCENCRLRYTELSDVS